MMRSIETTLYLIHPRGIELAGHIPNEIVRFDDPRPAREQINDRYNFGGGWSPMKGWAFDPKTFEIVYQGDEAYDAVLLMELSSGERLFVYRYAWVCIVQPNGTFEVSRMD